MCLALVLVVTLVGCTEGPNEDRIEHKIDEAPREYRLQVSGMT